MDAHQVPEIEDLASPLPYPLPDGSLPDRPLPDNPPRNTIYTVLWPPQHL